jgi:Tol biopolymer transport system component
MRRVIRRALTIGMLALLLAAPAASAAAPAGPRLAVAKFTLEPQRLELLSVDQLGAQPLRLAGGGRNARPLPYPLSFLSWRPDGSQLAFSGVVGSRRGRDGPPPLRIFLVGAEGGRPQVVPGTANAYGPVFAPDGRTVAFTRFRQRETIREGRNGTVKRRRLESATVWTIDLVTGSQRRLTPWRNGLEYIASSFSPDGSTLLTTRLDDRRTDTPEPIGLRLDGGGSTRLLIDGLFPVYSPDGSEIALFREQAEDSDLFVLDVATGSLRRLTRTPRTIELFASWDPSGERLAFVRFSAVNSEAASIGFGDSIMQVNADGTCPTRTLSAPRTAFYVPAWQPGLGREAGRIAC